MEDTKTSQSGQRQREGGQIQKKQALLAATGSACPSLGRDDGKNKETPDSDSEPVQVECPECGFANTFWGTKTLGGRCFRGMWR